MSNTQIDINILIEEYQNSINKLTNENIWLKAKIKQNEIPNVQQEKNNLEKEDAKK